MTTIPSFFAQPEAAARLRSETESWLGTPFVLRAAVKGQGVDCVYFVAEVMQTVGVIESYRFPTYSLDYALHNRESLVLAWLEQSPRVAKLPKGAPIQIGDVACFRYGRCVHHCGIMMDDLRMIHALEGRAVARGQLDDSTWQDRLECVYRPLPI